MRFINWRLVLADDLAVAGVEVEGGIELQFDDGDVGADGRIGQGEPEHAGDVGPTSAAADAPGEMGAVAAEHGGGADGVADALDSDLALGTVDLPQ